MSRIGFRILVLACGASTMAAAQQLDRARLDELTEAQIEPALEDFRAYLAIPNDAHYPEDIRRILDWMGAALEERGFRTQELATEGSPLLFAERSFADAEKTVLVYCKRTASPSIRLDGSQRTPTGRS